MSFCTQIKPKNNHKIQVEKPKILNSQSTSERKQQFWGTAISTFKLHYRVTATETPRRCHQHEQAGQQTQDLNEPTKLQPPAFRGRGPKTHAEEKTGSSTQGGGKLEVHMDGMKPEPHLLPCAKINFKWISDLNVRAQTWKLLPKEKKKRGENILRFWHCLRLSEKASKCLGKNSRN